MSQLTFTTESPFSSRHAWIGDKALKQAYRWVCYAGGMRHIPVLFEGAFLWKDRNGLFIWFNNLKRYLERGLK